jgi:charged multivesicular body protein 2A
MGNLFGTSKTPEQIMAETKVNLRVGKRQLERTKENLEESCETLLETVKSKYEEGKKEECKLYIRQVVRYRAAMMKLTGVIIKMEEMSLSLDLLTSQQLMQKAMFQITKSLMRINGAINIKGMSEIIQNFEKQGQMMDEKQQMVEHTMDASMSIFDDEKEETQMMKQIMDEIGIELDLPLNDNNNNVDKNVEEELKKTMNELKK